jgi:hypothetical protein
MDSIISRRLDFISLLGENQRELGSEKNAAANTDIKFGSQSKRNCMQLTVPKHGKFWFGI